MTAALKRLATVGAAVALLSVPFAANAASAQHNPMQDIPVTGTGGFTGTFNILGFINDGGVVKAVGTLTGTAAGQQVTQTIAWPVSSAATQMLAPNAQPGASCPILNLVLGPLHLDLLGLVVDLNQVVLNISAQPGNGNLLGNLLCAVANLLNGSQLGNLGTALLTSLTQLLNNLLLAL